MKEAPLKGVENLERASENVARIMKKNIIESSALRWALLFIMSLSILM